MERGGRRRRRPVKRERARRSRGCSGGDGDANEGGRWGGERQRFGFGDNDKRKN